jgi:hypothetical protein
MIQQINLYQDSGASDSRILCNPYVLTILTTVLVLIIVSGFSISKLHSNQAKQEQLQAQLQTEHLHLQQLQIQYPNQQIDAVLNQELQRTQGYYQNLSQTLEILADTQSDRSRGFSRYLSALASQSDSHVWLTAIRFNSETDSITLKGGTFTPEQIPLLLQRLQNTSVFKGRHFAKLLILQSDETPEQVNFSVSSSLKPETEEADARKH